MASRYRIYLHIQTNLAFRAGLLVDSIMTNADFCWMAAVQMCWKYVTHQQTSLFRSQDIPLLTDFIIWKQCHHSCKNMEKGRWDEWHLRQRTTEVTWNFLSGTFATNIVMKLLALAFIQQFQWWFLLKFTIYSDFSLCPSKLVWFWSRPALNRLILETSLSQTKVNPVIDLLLCSQKMTDVKQVPEVLFMAYSFSCKYQFSLFLPKEFGGGKSTKYSMCYFLQRHSMTQMLFSSWEILVICRSGQVVTSQLAWKRKAPCEWSLCQVPGLTHARRLWYKNKYEIKGDLYQMFPTEHLLLLSSSPCETPRV